MPDTIAIQDLKRMFFAAWSVRRLQVGEKTQTRRLLPFSLRWDDLHGEGSWEEDKERQVFVHELGPIQRLDRD